MCSVVIVRFYICVQGWAVFREVVSGVVGERDICC